MRVGSGVVIGAPIGAATSRIAFSPGLSSRNLITAHPATEWADGEVDLRREMAEGCAAVMVRVGAVSNLVSGRTIMLVLTANDLLRTVAAIPSIKTHGGDLLSRDPVVLRLAPNVRRCRYDTKRYNTIQLYTSSLM